MLTFLRPMLALMASATLGAAGFTGGIQLGAAFPQGDMKALTDSRLGSQLTLFGRWDLAGGQALRARLDGTAATGTPKTIPVGGRQVDLGGFLSASVGIGSLGVDYLQYFSGDVSTGPYAGAGLALGNTNLKLEHAGLAGEANASSAVLGLYAGYQFTRRWSVELTYRAARFDKTLTGARLDYTLPVLALCAGCTF